MSKLWDENQPVGTQELEDLLDVLSPRFPRFLIAEVNHEGEEHFVRSVTINGRKFDAGIVGEAKRLNLIYVNGWHEWRERKTVEIGLMGEGFQEVNQIALKKAIARFDKTSSKLSIILICLTIAIAVLTAVQVAVAVHWI